MQLRYSWNDSVDDVVVRQVNARCSTLCPCNGCLHLHLGKMSTRGSCLARSRGGLCTEMQLQSVHVEQHITHGFILHHVNIACSWSTTAALVIVEPQCLLFCNKHTRNTMHTHTRNNMHTHLISAYVKHLGNNDPCMQLAVICTVSSRWLSLHGAGSFMGMSMRALRGGWW